MSQEKVCQKCSTNRPLDQFYSNQKYCKECYKNYAKENRINHATNTDYVTKDKLICTKCKIEKPISDFTKDKGTRTGYKSVCKECRRKTTPSEPTTKSIWQSDDKDDIAKRSCNYCRIEKPESEFSDKKALCELCRNLQRRLERSKTSFDKKTQLYYAKIEPLKMDEGLIKIFQPIKTYNAKTIHHKQVYNKIEF
jgi:hypothetical protein